MMKVTTDTKGVTTVELSIPDRQTLARAKTLADKVAFHLRATHTSMDALAVAEGIANMLAPEEEDAG